MRETSKRVASKAGKVLRDKNSTPAEKAVAASALSQVEQSRQSHFTLLADHVREMLAANYLPKDSYWETVLSADMERIDEN